MAKSGYWNQSNGTQNSKRNLQKLSGAPPKYTHCTKNADLVTLKKCLMENFIFCAVIIINIYETDRIQEKGGVVWLAHEN